MIQSLMEVLVEVAVQPIIREEKGEAGCVLHSYCQNLNVRLPADYLLRCL